MGTSPRNTALIAVALVAVIGVAGCDSGGSSSSTSSTQPSMTDGPLSSSFPVGPGGAGGDQAAVTDPGVDPTKARFPIPMDEAISIAGKQFPGATTTKIAIEFDKPKQRWLWKVDRQKGSTQRELKIDTSSGKVVAEEHDEESGTPRAVQPQKLTPRAAAKKATALVPGTVAEWALEYDDGVQRYAFEIRTGGSDTQDVVVAVDTGKATRD